MKHTLLLVLLLPMCVGCDPGTSYKRVLANNTDKNMKFLFFGAEDHEHAREEINVEANSSIIIFRDTHIGGNPDSVEPLGDIDSVSVLIENHVLKKDMFDKGNWEINIKKRGRGYQHVYTFSIYPGDIE